MLINLENQTHTFLKSKCPQRN